MDQVINLNTVVGFKKLSNPAKELFEVVNKKHRLSIGSESKEDWIPVKVKEKRNCLEVYFRNGEWLHYYADRSWS